MPTLPLKSMVVVGAVLLDGCSLVEQNISPSNSINNDNTATQQVTADISYDLIHAPEGSYTLYIPDNNFFAVEYLTKEVTIKNGVWIGKYEISNRLWDLCFAMNGCNKPAQMRPGETLDSPVVRINWHDAFMFSNWFSKLTGKTYRLPTEEEWVYAAYLGKDHRNAEIQYDYSDLVAIKKISKLTKPTGSFKENDWGMADYQGNVWEWTNTCWYASEDNKLKKYTIDELNTPDACTVRIVQGENRSHIPDFISDTYSGGCATLEPAANLGFRLVLDNSQ